MIGLSNEAKNRLDNYLKQVRDSLRDCSTVDAEEVERNIIEHIENELSEEKTPVSIDKLEPVLHKLGSPYQWVPEFQQEIPWWRKLILRLHHGPEDWRLAYISFGILVIPLLIRLLFPWPRRTVGMFSIFLVIPAFILARAAIARINDIKLITGQKWLLYPSLLIVYIPVVFWILLGWPIVFVLETIGQRSFYNGLFYNFFIDNYKPLGIWSYTTDVGQGFGLSFIAAAMLGLWWTIVGIICAITPNTVRILFRPFADGFKRKYAHIVIIIGILLALIFAAVIVSSLR
jgi:hypothetical protein